MMVDPRLNDKMIKLYLSLPENKAINSLLKSTVKDIILNYHNYSQEELQWLENYLSCLISTKKMMDIPKQLNINIYNDQLPSLRNQYIDLALSAPKQYKSELTKLRNIMDKGLNLIITEKNAPNFPSKNASGFHLSKYNNKN